MKNETGHRGIDRRDKVFVRIETKTGENPVIRYQYDNHLGSACLELDITGEIISYEEYHPFGTTSYRSGRTEIEVSLKRYKYCGKERDEETGLYYYGMRYYAAWICRFISVDPLQFEYPYYTPYQYAGNKPISFIDLDGEEPKDINKKDIGVGTTLNILVSTSNPTTTGKALQNWGQGKIAEMYKEGYLKGSDNKTYKTSRMTEGYIKDPKTGLQTYTSKGANFGFKANGQTVTTKNINLSTPKTNLAIAGGKTLFALGAGFQFAGIFHAYATGGNVVEATNPIGFIMSDYLQRLDESLKEGLERKITDKIDKGYEATKKELQRNYQMKQEGYEFLDFNQTALDKIASGEITTYSQLRALFHSDENKQNQEYSLLIKMVDDNKSKEQRFLIRGSFLLPNENNK